MVTYHFSPSQGTIFPRQKQWRSYPWRGRGPCILKTPEFDLERILVAVLLVSRLAAASVTNSPESQWLEKQKQVYWMLMLHEDQPGVLLCIFHALRLSWESIHFLGHFWLPWEKERRRRGERRRACAQAINIRLEDPLTVAPTLHSPTQVHGHTYFYVGVEAQFYCLPGRAVRIFMKIRMD